MKLLCGEVFALRSSLGVRFTCPALHLEASTLSLSFCVLPLPLSLHFKDSDHDRARAHAHGLRSMAHAESTRGGDRSSAIGLVCVHGADGSPRTNSCSGRLCCLPSKRIRSFVVEQISKQRSQFWGLHVAWSDSKADRLQGSGLGLTEQQLSQQLTGNSLGR